MDFKFVGFNPGSHSGTRRSTRSNPLYSQASAPSAPSAYNSGSGPNLPSNIQGSISTYASRLRQNGQTSLTLPVNTTTTTRSGRATAKFLGENSDEDDFDDLMDEDEDGVGTPTPARTTRAGAAAAAGGGAGNAGMAAAELQKISRYAARRTKHVYRTEYEIDQAAEVEEALVPIRIDIEADDVKIRDAFMWNMNERLLTPESFAEMFCEDLNLQPQKFVTQIAESIRQQCVEYEIAHEIEVPEEVDWRVIINLDVQVGRLSLRDRFEWDLSSTLTPEQFARQLAADLGLGGEFISLIAHAIHEQICRSKKERIEDVFDEPEESVRELMGPFRRIDDGYDWTPILESLTIEDLEKKEIAREREVRRLRRDASRYSRNRRRSISSLIPSRSNSQMGFNSPGPQGKKSNKFERSSGLLDTERMAWQCSWCRINGMETSGFRRGPGGSRTLCNVCGLSWLTRGRLPEQRKDMYSKVESNGQAKDNVDKTM